MLTPTANIILDTQYSPITFGQLLKTKGMKSCYTVFTPYFLVNMAKQMALMPHQASPRPLDKPQKAFHKCSSDDRRRLWGPSVEITTEDARRLSFNITASQAQRDRTTRLTQPSTCVILHATKDSPRWSECPEPRAQPIGDKNAGLGEHNRHRHHLPRQHHCGSPRKKQGALSKTLPPTCFTVGGPRRRETKASRRPIQSVRKLRH